MCDRDDQHSTDEPTDADGRRPHRDDSESASRSVGELTRILDDCQRGEDGATDRLFSIVYDELHRMARRKMIDERRGPTLQTTALVNEAYLRLVDRDGQSRWQNRAHFFGAAARAMRQILVDRARRRDAKIRGGGERNLTLDERLPAPEVSIDFLALDQALEALGAEHPRVLQVVHLKYFLQMTNDETAKLLGVARRTVNSDWAFAKAWLNSRLASSLPEPPGAADES